MTRDLILGTAGHIDHGKTSLVKALTGVDCDRLPEEKARGITIDIGFARLELPPYRLGIVDDRRLEVTCLAHATQQHLAQPAGGAGVAVDIGRGDVLQPLRHDRLDDHGR